MSENFKRVIEDFVCDKCGCEVSGDGYTNHCPKCLWSKHVDINPGDRSAGCEGMMEPISIETKGGETRIVHICKKCSIVCRNRVSSFDDENVILELFKQSGY